MIGDSPTDYFILGIAVGVSVTLLTVAAVYYFTYNSLD